MEHTGHTEASPVRGNHGKFVIRKRNDPRGPWSEKRGHKRATRRNEGEVVWSV